MSDELPFVIQPPGDASVAAGAARSAAATWGLPEPEHLRTGMNALFVAGDDVILRVSCTTAPAEQAVWLMSQLRRLGVMVPRQLRDGPLIVDDLAVFAIERLYPAGAVDWATVGAMTRRVHDWSAADVVGRYPLPRCEDFPWWNTTRAVADVDDLLDEPARHGLVATIAAHGGWSDQVTTRAVCHGDVHPGNVVQTSAGPVLIDWDLLCHAPTAWDHATLMRWTTRWGGDLTMYARYAQGYGQSMLGDPVAESVAIMRNVIATLMRLKVGRTNPAAAEEAQRRLRFWRGDPDAPQWVAQ